MNDNPFVRPIASMQMVHPKVESGTVGVVILDAVEPDVIPEYCVHGKTTCYGCGDWCWLGSETYKVITSGEVAPLCLRCAHKKLPREARPSEHIHDHRRTDGPHD